MPLRIRLGISLFLTCLHLLLAARFLGSWGRVVALRIIVILYLYLGLLQFFMVESVSLFKN